MKTEYDSRICTDNDSSHKAGLYIHIPFCRSKCPYCSFYSLPLLNGHDDFVRSAIREMSLYEKEFKSFDTIYIGGGTPSLLSYHLLDAILCAARNTFEIAPASEITLEANPCDITPTYAESLLLLGINRLSIGVQSFNDSTLLFLGRNHTSRMAEDAIANARNAGFSNISIDLIYGVPGQDITSWKTSLSKAISFYPHHLSCYQLTIENDTPLGRQYRDNCLVTSDDSIAYEYFMTTSRILHEAGYFHYEVSNFAQQSYRSQHNQKYWNHTPYLGIGPSSHSFLNGRRWWNHRCIEDYKKDLQIWKKPVADSEILSNDDFTIESIFLGLRYSDGFDLSCLPRFSLQEAEIKILNSLNILSNEGYVITSNGRIYPTVKGMAVADSLSSSLIDAL